MDSIGFIDYYYVHPGFQGRGVGKALMKTIVEEAVAQGVDKMVANVSITDRFFFELQGFKVTESRSNVILGYPAPNFTMCKNLSSEQDGAEKPRSRDKRG